MAIVKEATRRKMKKGDTVFMQSDLADEVFTVLVPERRYGNFVEYKADGKF